MSSPVPIVPPTTEDLTIAAVVVLPGEHPATTIARLARAMLEHGAQLMIAGGAKLPPEGIPVGAIATTRTTRGN